MRLSRSDTLGAGDVAAPETHRGEGGLGVCVFVIKKVKGGTHTYICCPEWHNDAKLRGRQYEYYKLSQLYDKKEPLFWPSQHCKLGSQGRCRARVWDESWSCALEKIHRSLLLSRKDRPFSTEKDGPFFYSEGSSVFSCSISGKRSILSKPPHQHSSPTRPHEAPCHPTLQCQTITNRLAPIIFSPCTPYYLHPFLIAF